MSVFIYSLKKTITQCFSINGRSSRREFWPYFFMYLFIISLVTIKMNALTLSDATGNQFWIFGSYLSFTLLVIFLTICFFTLSIRRLHDLNIKGHWLFLLTLPNLIYQIALFLPPSFIPSILTTALIMLNNIVVIGFFILFAKQGSKIENKYGLPPISQT